MTKKEMLQFMELGLVQGIDISILDDGIFIGVIYGDSRGGCSERGIKTSKGEYRSFKSLDTAYKFISENMDSKIWDSPWDCPVRIVEGRTK